MYVTRSIRSILLRYVFELRKCESNVACTESTLLQGTFRIPLFCLFRLPARAHIGTRSRRRLNEFLNLCLHGGGGENKFPRSAVQNTTRQGQETLVAKAKALPRTKLNAAAKRRSRIAKTLTGPTRLQREASFDLAILEINSEEEKCFRRRDSRPLDSPTKWLGREWAAQNVNSDGFVPNPGQSN